MPNLIKYSTSAVTYTIKKGNIVLGVNNVDYGPTSTSGFYNGITPPISGYTFYINKPSGGPSIYVSTGDTQTIQLIQSLGGTGSTIENTLSWVASQSDIVVSNRDYENIVTSGMVLNLDAGFTGSYPKGNQQWYDISGSGNTGTLTNGPTFNSLSGGSIVFDGTNDYVNVSPVILNTPWSLCTTVKASNSGYPALYSQDGLCLWVGVTPNLAIGVHTNFAARVDTPAGSFNLNQVYFVGISSSPSSLTVYINNTKYSLTPGANPTAATIASIASYSDKTKDFLSGNIYNFSMYNRALTDTEILQNYNALRGRYGI